MAVLSIMVPVEKTLLNHRPAERLPRPNVRKISDVIGLIAMPGEFPVDGRDVLVGGDRKAGEVFGEVASLRFVGEQVAEVPEGFLDDLGELDDAGHGGVLQRIGESTQ
jgi:hypothetical protein